MFDSELKTQENKIPWTDSFKILQHEVAFVKRENEISWFDPNYGEITFSNFKDFSIWFREEVKEGTLNYLFCTSNDDLRQYQMFDKLFPQPEFTSQQETENILSTQIVNRRRKVQNDREMIKAEVAFYNLYSFSGDTYIYPKKMEIDNASNTWFTLFNQPKKNNDLTSVNADVEQNINMQTLNQLYDLCVEKINTLEKQGGAELIKKWLQLREQLNTLVETSKLLTPQDKLHFPDDMTMNTLQKEFTLLNEQYNVWENTIKPKIR